MIRYGTNVVGGVTPGKGGETILDRPVFNTVKGAVAETGAEASIVFVPPPFAADAIMEAADAGIRYCTCITDGIPAQDMMRVKRFMRRYRAENRMRLTGPELRGHDLAGQGDDGDHAGPHLQCRAMVGIVGRSGTLGYEAASQMKALGIGVSTSVGIGGDPINGSSFRDILELFEQDPDTRAVMMIGEIGGPQEAEAAAYARDHMTKPVVAYVAGLSAPKGRTMGHAGAIISAFGESAQEKVEILEEAGVTPSRQRRPRWARPWPGCWRRWLSRPDPPKRRIAGRGCARRSQKPKAAPKGASSPRISSRSARAGPG